MQKKTWIMIWIVVTLTRIVLTLPLVAGEHDSEELSCNDIPEEKLQDCEYILNSNLNQEEKQELLDILNAQNYEYNWQSLETEEIQESERGTQEIDNDTLLFAWDIFVFIFFNYFIFSILTKSSFFARCLNVVC